MAQPNSALFPHGVLGAIRNLQFDPTGMATSEVETTNQVFTYNEAVIRILGAYGFFDIERSLSQPAAPRDYMIWIKPAELNGQTITESDVKVYNPDSQTFIDMNPDVFVSMIMFKAMKDATIFKNASQDERGLMTKDHFKKVEGVEENANDYTHPSGNGNKHVAPNSTADKGKALIAGTNEGEFEWGKVNANDVETTEQCRFVTEVEYQGILSLLQAANINVTGDIELI